MSGLPSSDGVQKFKALLKQMSDADTKKLVITNNIERAKLDLEKVEEIYREAYTELFKLMQSMDIASDGNYGWKNRMSWFLIELNRQFEQES